MTGGGGFPPAALRFFEDLEDDNSKAFWAAHAGVYTAAVREPMVAVLDSLPERYQGFRVLRMHRDLRFTNDKSPYKTQQGALLEGDDGVDHYLHLAADGLLAACGVYQLEPDELGRYRDAVADGRSGPALQRVLEELEAAGVQVSDVGAPALKSAPRGYPRDHPRIDLLRRKGVLGSRRLNGPGLADRDAVRDFLVGCYDDCGPLLAWLRRHVARG